MEALRSYFYYPKGIFFVKSWYALLAIDRYVDNRSTKFWSIKAPIRVEAFLWLLEHDRTLSIEEKGGKSYKCLYYANMMLKQTPIFSLLIVMNRPFGTRIRIYLLGNGLYIEGFRISFIRASTDHFQKLVNICRE
ncbi:hypothetical protein AMTRI_Chr05g65790 [Amborella trichopoda]